MAGLPATSPLPGCPPTIEVRQVEGGLRLVLPRRPSSRRGGQSTVFVGALVLYVAIQLGLPLVLPGASDAVGPLLGLLVGLVVGVGAALLYLRSRRSLCTGRLTVVGSILELEVPRLTRVPLERIQAIAIIEGEISGHLRLELSDGTLDCCDGLFAPELRWVRSWLTGLVRERNRQLERLAPLEGYDPAADAS